jgi:hypothetical protein
MGKAAVAMHSISLSHHIQFYDTGFLAKKSGHVECITMELAEIVLHPNTCKMKRDESFSFSKSWKPLIQTMKE